MNLFSFSFPCVLCDAIFSSFLHSPLHLFFFLFLSLPLPLCIQNTHSNRTHILTVGRVNETAKNAARERTRVKSLRDAFSRLQSLIPNVPPDTKLSKLDVLILASSHIRHLTDLLSVDVKAFDASTGECQPSFSFTNSLSRGNNTFLLFNDVSSDYCGQKSNPLVSSSSSIVTGAGVRGNKYLRPVRVSQSMTRERRERHENALRRRGVYVTVSHYLSTPLPPEMADAIATVRW